MRKDESALTERRSSIEAPIHLTKRNETTPEANMGLPAAHGYEMAADNSTL
jgi:hypothetical protein